MSKHLVILKIQTVSKLTRVTRVNYFRPIHIAMEKAWNNSCLDGGVPSSVADSWLVRLLEHHGQTPSRVYHNANLLEFKFNLLDSLGIVPSTCLVFAICFQNYEYDVRQDCLDQNLAALREFCAEAKVKVSEFELCN